jgi:hypothetical protein
MVAAPFQQEEWYTIGQLRTVAAGILRARQSARQLSAKLRTQRRDQRAAASRTVGGSATPAARRANDEAFAVVLDFRLGQRVEIGDVFGFGG